ncbi:DUF2635 domain-containing protein [Methylobacterium thuringiense]|uniref:DUF2635 domain-containing protein n=1 Tax=Methylobacterium thuringiense TaxID=1003091 RepID=A0ABQ4TI07_9HYPH|nr:DUF2635 domain-containing protein [Methylobacterium thuringiense]GJE54576.1 hypothetical protein EKPJFOCH_1054 [Methylobacterium thuringiense]
MQMGFVKPHRIDGKPALVRMPERAFAPLPATGASVPMDEYWARRIRDKDVFEADDPSAETAADEPEAEPAAKKARRASRQAKAKEPAPKVPANAEHLSAPAPEAPQSDNSIKPDPAPEADPSVSKEP